jgi:hypothetical protein
LGLSLQELTEMPLDQGEEFSLIPPASVLFPRLPVTATNFGLNLFEWNE